MTYTTQAILIEAFGEEELVELLDRDQDEASDGGVLDRAIAYADSVIDGYLRGRYTLPMTAAPALIVGIANDLVRYRLYDAKAPEEVASRNKQGIEDLKRIAAGVIVLDAAEASRSSSLTAFEASDRTFTVETLEAF